MIDLCSKYRPTTLKDVYGQPHVSGFFQSVAKRPDDSPRYYLLQGPWGSGKCVAGDTLVVTPAGVRSVRSLFPDTLPDKEGVVESPVPYRVMDGFGELAESTMLYYSGVVPTVRVRSVSAPDLVCTPHHPLYAFDSVTGRFGWVQARELVPQRHTLMTSASPVSGSMDIDPDWYAYGVVFGAKSWVAASSSFKRASPDSLCLSHWCLERIKGSETSRGISLDDFKTLGLFPQGCFPAFWTGSFPSGVSLDSDSLSFLLDKTLEEQVSFALGYLANNIKISSPSVFLTRVLDSHFPVLQTILSAAGLGLRPYLTQSKSSFVLTCGLHSVFTLPNLFKGYLGLDRLECDIPSAVESGHRSTVVRGLVQSLRRNVSITEFLPFIRYKHGGVQSLFRYLDDPCVLGEVSPDFVPSEVLGVDSAGLVECFDLSLPTIRHSFTANTIVSHNTSVARAFAHDLLGPDYASQPNYMEIDSSEKAVTENFDYFRDMMFQELPGWKVVVLDECLHYASVLWIRDPQGRVFQRRIGTIVSNHEPFEVLSCDSDGNFVWKKITGFHKNQAKPMFKYTFRLSSGRMQTLVATSNHLVKLPSGDWIPVGDLSVGSEVHIVKHHSSSKGSVRLFHRKPEIYVEDTAESEQFLLGTLLGDSSIRLAHSRSKSLQVTCVQGGKQWFYFYEKERILKSLLSTRRVYDYEGFQSAGDGVPLRSIFSCVTKSLPYFDKFSDLLVDGKRTISRSYLDRLSPLGIAVWFMDDGSFTGWRMRDGVRVKLFPGLSGSIHLSTHGFGYDGNVIIQDYFKDVWDISFRLIQDKRLKESKSWYLTTADVESTRKFCELVAPYVLTEFQYKLGWYAEAGDGLRSVPPLSLSFRTREPSAYVISSPKAEGFYTESATLECVTPCLDKHRPYTYDITVEDTHCYYANGILVHNCHLLPPTPTSQQLLKILEDYVGRLFILFATTNPELMFPPLLSRLHKFSICLFSTEQVQEYLRGISNAEGFQVSDQTLSLIALNAQGHMRDAVKGLELVMATGEERYLSSFAPVWREVESYFLSSDVDPDHLVSTLSPYPASQLKSYFSYFMRHRILNPKSQGYGETFPVQFLPKLYSTWLSMSAKVTSQDEFFGMLLAMLPVISGLRGRR